MNDDRRPRLVAIAFGVASAVHIADHLRRGQGSTTDALLAAGNAALVMQVVAVTLVLAGHRLGPLVALATGPQLALAFTAAHWLPRWSDLSDPIWEIESWPWLSGAASIAEIVTAAALGLAGWQVVHRRGLASFAR